MWRHFLDLKHFSSKQDQVVSQNKIHIQSLPDKLSESSLSKHLTCVSRTYSQPQPVNQINLHTSLCLSPDKLSESSLSKHLTCVSRTYSQPQPVEIFSSITKKCRFRQSIDKSPSSKWPYSQHAQKESETKPVTWIKNTKALRCPWLYISNVPT